MKSEFEQQTVLKLILTQEEAYWLKCMVQNPIVENETQFDANMRERFFNEIAKTGI